MSLLGPYLVGCALLVIAGAAKARLPHDTAAALARIWPHVTASRVRAMAGAEATLGLLAMVFPTPLPAGLVATSYLGLAVFVVHVRTRGGALASCGCFGRPDTPATRSHVVLNLLFGLAAVAVARAGNRDALTAVLGRQPGAGVPLVLVVTVSAALAASALSSLPALVGLRRQLGGAA